MNKVERRAKIKKGIRAKISGIASRPRLTVFRSNVQIYAQIIDDLTGKTLVSASSMGLEKAPKIEMSAAVGALIAKKALDANISTVVFDRNGYLFHGRVKALADSARKGGLNF